MSDRPVAQAESSFDTLNLMLTIQW